MNTNISRQLQCIIASVPVILSVGCFAQPGLTGKSSTVPITNATAAGAAPGQASPPATVRPVHPPANISPAVAEVITLSQSGVEEAVVKSFVANSTNAFNPTLDEIIYLNDVGVPGPLVAALIQQSTKAREARDQLAAATRAAAAANLAAAPQPVKIIIDDRRAQVAAEPAKAAAAAPAAPAVAQPAPQPAPVAAPPAVVNYNYFYDSLAPYGSWVEVSGYGRCWQPSVVLGNRGWRPYADRGRWLWKNHGWYWQSDYSWGWAPFHYGRWAQDATFGWVWVPGDVWAPSWVSWRTCDSHIGWAPLPPHATYRAGIGFNFQGGVITGYEWNLSLGHYTFVAVGRFCDRNPGYYAVPVTQVRNIYNQTIINNNYITTNNAVINQGLPADRVTALTRQEVRKVTIRDLPASGATVRADRVEKEGAELVIYRPQLQTQPPPRPAVLSSGGAPTAVGQATTAQNSNAIVGRPVIASNGGAPVVTGYTTQPATAGTAGIPSTTTPTTAATQTNAPRPIGTFGPPATKGTGVSATTHQDEPVGAPGKTGVFTRPANTTPVKKVEVKPVPNSTNANSTIGPQPYTSTVSAPQVAAPQPATSVAPTPSLTPTVRQEITKPPTFNPGTQPKPSVSTFGLPPSQPAPQPYSSTTGPAKSTTVPANPAPAPNYNPAPPTSRPTFTTQPAQPSYSAPPAPSINPPRSAPTPQPSYTPPSSPQPPSPAPSSQPPSPTGNPKQEQKK